MAELATKNGLKDYLGVGEKVTEKYIEAFLHLAIIPMKYCKMQYFYLPTVKKLLDDKTKYSYQNKKKPLGKHLELTEEEIDVLVSRFGEKAFAELVPQVNMKLSQKKRNEKIQPIKEVFEEAYERYGESL